ncbi:unnamed protein product [Amoebophrya sp. A120]|nr:unnamed protein product [Amoebophrya sp. A120]|eukprot:GSA120T00014877001.1
MLHKSFSTRAARLCLPFLESALASRRDQADVVASAGSAFTEGRATGDELEDDVSGLPGREQEATTTEQDLREDLPSTTFLLRGRRDSSTRASRVHRSSLALSEDDLVLPRGGQVGEDMMVPLEGRGTTLVVQADEDSSTSVSALPGQLGGSSFLQQKQRKEGSFSCGSDDETDAKTSASSGTQAGQEELSFGPDDEGQELLGAPEGPPSSDDYRIFSQYLVEKGRCVGNYAIASDWFAEASELHCAKRCSEHELCYGYEAENVPQGIEVLEEGMAKRYAVLCRFIQYTPTVVKWDFSVSPTSSDSKANSTTSTPTSHNEKSNLSCGVKKKAFAVEEK